MIDSYQKYDVIIVKFPFASSLIYKARPAVVISSNFYNKNSRDTLIILAISSKIENKLNFEKEIINWQSCNLLKPSIFKSAIATIEKNFVIEKLGVLSNNDRKNLDELLDIIL